MWKFFPQSNQPTPNEKKKESVAKKVESAVQHIGLKTGNSNRPLRNKNACGKSGFFYHRENDLLNQEIRTIRVLDELIFFSIDDDETIFFDGFAKMSINNYLELIGFDFFQFLKKFDFSSIPISASATFQK